ncbi:MAG: hypothetical protein [Caudoviricetes sp.]|nr:MAG: hypothetical protein [Caudoviricetes sp.]
MTNGEKMDSKDTKTAKIVLNKKQLCASIQFLESPCYSYLKKIDIDPDGEESKAIVLVLSVFFEQMTKQIWQRLNDDDKVTVPLKVPDLNEEEE